MMMQRHDQYLPALQHLMQLPSTPPLDWQSIAEGFEQFVMDPTNGVCFTDARGNTAFTAFLEGETAADAKHELVSYGPIVLGKALLGQDVDELLPSLSGFYSDSSGIFLNTPGQHRIEMWYLMYVLSMAAHLIARTSREDEDLREQLLRSFRTLRDMTRRIDYDFNHQGYDFDRNSPWTRKDIYRQPDAIGGYAYLMLIAHNLYGEETFLEEATSAMTRYLAFEQNPWYEVPSGAMAVTASAILGAMGRASDTTRALGFLLDPQAGLVTGRWGSRNVTGLYRGWRHSTPESAYSLETLVALPYLLPAVRYRPDLGRVVGAYALHVASNARHFYSEYCEGNESRGDLSPVVAYERLYRSHGGRDAYAAGDFLGHKSVYGGAYALWWAALTTPTEEPYIIGLDLAATDFLTPQAWPTCLYYNPHDTRRAVRLTHDGSLIYDLAEHRDLVPGHDYRVTATGVASIEVGAGDARALVLIPHEAPRRLADGILSVNGIPVDYDAEPQAATRGEA